MLSNVTQVLVASGNFNENKLPSPTTIRLNRSGKAEEPSGIAAKLLKLAQEDAEIAKVRTSYFH